MAGGHCRDNGREVNKGGRFQVMSEETPTIEGGWEVRSLHDANTWVESSSKGVWR